MQSIVEKTRFSWTVAYAQKLGIVHPCYEAYFYPSKLNEVFASKIARALCKTNFLSTKPWFLYPGHTVLHTAY